MALKVLRMADYIGTYLFLYILCTGDFLYERPYQCGMGDTFHQNDAPPDKKESSVTDYRLLHNLHWILLHFIHDVHHTTTENAQRIPIPG